MKNTQNSPEVGGCPAAPCSPAVKPPLGLKPRFIAAEHRLWEIIAAYQRFLEAGHAPRIEWAEELLELTKYLASRKSSQANDQAHLRQPDRDSRKETK